MATTDSLDARRFVALASSYRPLAEHVLGWPTGHRVVLTAVRECEVAVLLNGIDRSADRDPPATLPPSGHFPSASAHATLAASGRNSASQGASR